MSWYDIRFYVFIAALIFLFIGEPDVWDRLHDAAMSSGCVK